MPFTTQPPHFAYGAFCQRDSISETISPRGTTGLSIRHISRRSRQPLCRANRPVEDRIDWCDLQRPALFLQEHARFWGLSIALSVLSKDTNRADLHCETDAIQAGNAGLARSLRWRNVVIRLTETYRDPFQREEHAHDDRPHTRRTG